MTEETNRDRVRRLLFQPLDFRVKRGDDPDRVKAMCDTLADELSHFSDDELGVLCRLMAPMGDGAKRDFWPSVATFRGLARRVHPRPMMDDPKLRSWFVSVEGPKCIEEGTLLETVEFYRVNGVVPWSDQARAWVKRQAEENRARLQRVDDRRQRGVSSLPGEDEWARWYRERCAFLTELVRAEREKSASGDAA